jgi:hypothetical protein
MLGNAIYVNNTLEVLLHSIAKVAILMLAQIVMLDFKITHK